MSDKASVRSIKSSKKQSSSKRPPSYDLNNDKLRSIDEIIQPELFDIYLPYCCKQNCSLISPRILITSQKKYRSELDFTTLNDDRHTEILENQTDYNIIAISNSAQINRKTIITKIIIKNIDIDQGFMLALKMSLEYQKYVECLKFINCNLKNCDVTKIKDVLQFNCQIIELCIERAWKKSVTNFHILLQDTSLRYLSLKFCQINDDDIKEIANELNMIHTNLQILNLTSNFITDIGVSYLVKALRLNRSLISLNLANNYLTDQSCIDFCNALMQFELIPEEIKIKRKIVFENLISQKKLTEDTKSQKNRSPRIKTSAKLLDDLTVITPHPFVTHCIQSDGNIYCKGNLYLTHLNLAYNNITGDGISKLIDILEDQIKNLDPNTDDNVGLTRLVIDGNKLTYEHDTFDAYHKKIEDLIEIKINK